MTVIEYPVMGMVTTYGASAWRWHRMLCFKFGSYVVLLAVASLASVSRRPMTTISFDEFRLRLPLPTVLALLSGSQPMTGRSCIQNPVCT